MKSKPTFYILSVALTLLWVTASSIYATIPPVPPYNRSWSVPTNAPNRLNHKNIDRKHPQRDWDNYIGKFELLCEFLTSMQELDPQSRDYGGLHEGEGDYLWGLVETDNTQEAIRVWSEYSRFFEDYETYRENIDAAFEYCDAYPAWDESPPGDEMYSLHNSGWGLIAEMGFRQAFGDSSHRDYGVRCADYLVENTPKITPEMPDSLMPLVAGWAAGTLYRYGEYEANAEYRNAAVAIAEEVKEWIEAAPVRLYNDENWALCGGTAMWGVLNSLGRVDSAVTSEWAQEALGEMDVFAGIGQWNNSWNIWYAHAWIAAWKLTGDESYRDNAVAILDSLLVQDGDSDGGIPATIGDSNDRDQAWVTAYTGWMGLRQLFDQLPQGAVSIFGIKSPSTNRPWPVRESLTFEIEAANQSPNESLEIQIGLDGTVQTDSTVVLAGWNPQTITFNDLWTPAQPGDYSFTAYVHNDQDCDFSDDTLQFTLRIFPVGELPINSLASDGTPVGCQLDFQNLEEPEVSASFSVPAESGFLAIQLMIGRYRVQVTPDFPYAGRVIDEIQITEAVPNRMEMKFSQPPVLLVDGDTDTTHYRYYTETLTAGGYDFYRWRSPDYGAITSKSGTFNCVIYFTGDRDSATISESDQEELRSFVESGGGLFVTGQNITDDLAGNSFLGEVLHCQPLADDVNRSLVDGRVGDELMDGLNLLILGNRGANNQTSPSGTAATGDGVACAFYRNAGDTAAAVKWQDPSGGRGVFFSFGFEAISGMGETSQRDQVMAAVLNWLEAGQSAPRKHDAGLAPESFGWSVYPNPTNGIVRIRLRDSRNSLSELEIVDLEGRLLDRLTANGTGQWIWNCRDRWGKPAPTGLYWAKTTDVDPEANRSIQKILLIR